MEQNDQDIWTPRKSVGMWLVLAAASWGTVYYVVNGIATGDWNPFD